MIPMTSSHILSLVWEVVRNSSLHDAVPTMYKDHFPTAYANSMKEEFIVIKALSNAIADTQIATVNINIYVPDTTPRINKEEQRYPNYNRLEELTTLAYEALRCYPTDARFFFDVQGESLFSEGDIPYTFSNIKVQLKNY